MYFFYVEANEAIGTGHFRRCLYLALELKNSALPVAFISNALNETCQNELRSNNFPFLYLDEVSPGKILSVIKNNSLNRSLLIIDSDNKLFYSADFQQNVRTRTVKLMLFTVNPQPHYFADILLNPNIIALYQEYSTGNYTTRLFGPHYFIFQPAFRKIDITAGNRGKNEIFVAFGGADPAHFSIKVLSWLKDPALAGKYHINMVIGALNQDARIIKEMAKPLKNVTVHYKSSDMYNIMKGCSIAVCSPGTTFWELGLLGIPSILLSSSEREIPLTEFLDKKQFAIALGHYNEQIDDKKHLLFKYLSPEIIFEQVKINELRKLINPKGIYEVVEEMKKLMNTP